MIAARRRAPPRLRPKGAVAVPFAVMSPVMLGCIGRAIDLSMACSSGTLGSSATVPGFGRFFMTQPATPTAVYGEFAGLVSADKLATQVALHQ
jgi:hypothetical protein